MDFLEHIIYNGKIETHAWVFLVYGMFMFIVGILMGQNKKTK